MTKAAYDKLSLEAQHDHDKFMAEYYAGDYYRKLSERYMPQINKMDKSHLSYSICNGANLFGMDHFAWKKLKELGPEKNNLQFIVEFGMYYNPEIYEETKQLFQEL